MDQELILEVSPDSEGHLRSATSAIDGADRMNTSYLSVNSGSNLRRSRLPNHDHARLLGLLPANQPGTMTRLHR